ncbi:hypothetical protein [Halalkalibacillus halophilus]|uniref:hypothetical protein n=1 Tax=Halalkalibacillus halophilus TaxID=392827 RepID=UPI00040C9710|nr:hypothetical protein [Halalkalibacillus halophilus]
MRYLAILLAAMMFLAACNGDDEPDTEENGTDDQETEETEEGTEEDMDEESDENGDSQAEGDTEQQVMDAMNGYSDAMDEFYTDNVEGSEPEIENVESQQEVADWFVENAPVTEEFAENLAERVTEEDNGSLTWVDNDYSVLFEAEEDDNTRLDVYEFMEGNWLVNKTISGEAEEDRGHYNYNVYDEDGEWLVGEFHFGYLDGEHPDDQVEEEEEAADEEESEEEESDEDSEEDSEDEEDDE